MTKAVCRIVALLLVLCLGGPSFASAKSPASEEAIRSLILARLAGQIYWSKDSDLNDKNTRYRLCIYRDRDYFVSIRKLLQTRTVNGEKIQFQFTRELEELKGCHISYLGDVTQEDINKILKLGLRKETIFVASNEDSAASGLHIRLFVGDARTINIEVNEKAFATGGNEPKLTFVKLAKKVYLLDGTVREQ